MRIGFVYPAYWPYVRRGVERLIHDLASDMVSRGHQVDIITSKPGPTRVHRVGDLTVHYLAMRQNPVLMAYAPLLPFYLFGLDSLRLLLKSRYDLLHIWTYSFAWGAPLLRRLRGVPYLFHVIVNEPHWQEGVDRWAYDKMLLGANQVAVLTARAAEYIEGQYKVRPRVLPPAVDTGVFRPRGNKDTSTPRVLFAADLGDDRKGGHLMLRSWNEIHHRCPSARLVLAGPFGFARTAKGRGFLDMIPYLVPDQSARSAIDILGTGSLEALPALYSQSAVTVLPSVQEAFGMVVIESLASGTPVVCSDSAGPGEIVNGDTRIGRQVPLRELHDLFSFRQVLPLAEAVVDAIALAGTPDTETYCRERAMQWSLDRVGTQVEATYVDLLAQSGRRHA